MIFVLQEVIKSECSRPHREFNDVDQRWLQDICWLFTYMPEIVLIKLLFNFRMERKQLHPVASKHYKFVLASFKSWRLHNPQYIISPSVRLFPCFLAQEPTLP